MTEIVICIVNSGLIFLPIESVILFVVNAPSTKIILTLKSQDNMKKKIHTDRVQFSEKMYHLRPHSKKKKNKAADHRKNASFKATYKIHLVSTVTSCECYIDDKI